MGLIVCFVYLSARGILGTKEARRGLVEERVEGWDTLGNRLSCREDEYVV